MGLIDSLAYNGYKKILPRGMSSILMASNGTTSGGKNVEHRSALRCSRIGS